jgi:predicted acyl esterase
MRIDWDLPIEMDDGIVLRADLFRPISEGRFPVIMAYGGYGKNLRWQEGFPDAWQQVLDKYPEITEGSSSNYMSWEYVDPEKFVPEGYAVLRVDARGCGRSPGFVDNMSGREGRDYYNAIEWAGTQPWSTGKVGLAGVSYLAIMQWQAASRQPSHLAAMFVWEGGFDPYRDLSRHGGILNTFTRGWFKSQVQRVQHGLGSRGPTNPYTGILVAGDENLSDEELAANRTDVSDSRLAHFLDDEYYQARAPRGELITAPLLSAGNWGGAGLHGRGNIEGYVQAASAQKWLNVHGGQLWVHFYDRYGVQLQKRFFAHFLKGEGDWGEQPPVTLQIRHPGERYVERAENEWPLARTNWTELHLQPESASLSWEPPAKEQAVSYDSLGEGLTLSTEPFEQETEITGPVACKLWISSSTEDADIFLVLRLFAPDGSEVLFQGAIEPRAPLTLGWLRASHRKLDPARSTRERPFHAHDEVQPLVPDEIYELAVEIWPTCIVIPPGYRLALSVLGRDFDHGLSVAGHSSGRGMRGAGPFLHNDPTDRPPRIFDNQVTVHSGPAFPSHLLVPVIPAR